MPLFASTATTTLSFTPMILLQGAAGDFVGSIALAVVIMLCWSFVVAVTVTPAIAGWVMPTQARGGWLAQGVPSGILGRIFAASLRLSIRNPLRSIALALVLPVLGFACLPLLTAQFFPGVDRDQFTIDIDLAPGTGIGRTQMAVATLDARLRATDGIESVTWTIGRAAPAFYYNIVGGRDAAPGHAQALIRTTSAAATARVLPMLERDLPILAPDAQVLVRGLVQGPPVGAPVELRLVGDDLETLRVTGADLRRIADAAPMVTLTRASITEGAPKLGIEVDEASARLIGLTPGAVARQLEAALVGTTGARLIEGSEELPVRIRLGDGLRTDPSAIWDMPLILSQGIGGTVPATPLSAVADVALIPGDGSITRRNGARANTVQALVQAGVLPDGVRLEIGGDADARASTLNSLIASQFTGHEWQAFLDQQQKLKLQGIWQTRGYSDIGDTRMGKRRRIRWSPQGAHRVAVTRAAVLDGRLWVSKIAA